VCVGLRQFLGVFFPSISTTHWLGTRPRAPLAGGAYGFWAILEIGVSTANLTGIAIRDPSGHCEYLGVGLGAFFLIQNVFTSAKAISLAALICWRFTVAAARRPGLRISPVAPFWKNAEMEAMHPVQVGAADRLCW